MVPANDLSSPGEQTPNENAQTGGNAGFTEHNLDNQSFAVDMVGLSIVSGSDQTAIGVVSSADQTRINSYSALATNGHAVEAQSNSFLGEGQGNLVVDTGVGHVAETGIKEGGASIDESAIDVANFNIGLDATIPRSEGAGSDLQILDLEKISLLSFPSSSGTFGQFSGSEGVGLVPASELNQDEGG
ncbi:MAG: hypothetical protein ABL960_07780 [Nitrospira sp.]